MERIVVLQPVEIRVERAVESFRVDTDSLVPIERPPGAGPLLMVLKSAVHEGIDGGVRGRSHGIERNCVGRADR
jgi:hypothetical protein